AYLLERDYQLSLPRLLQIEFSQVVQKITDATGKELRSEEIRAAFDREYLHATSPLTYLDHRAQHNVADGRVEQLTARLTPDARARLACLADRGRGCLRRDVTSKATFRPAGIVRRGMPISGVPCANHTNNIRRGESMPGKLRIFWTTEEKNVVLAAARTLRERQPRSTLKQVGTRAQATLPKQRRRPVNNKLTSWLSTSLKGGPPIAGGSARAKVTRAAPAPAPRTQRAKAVKAV